MPSIGGFAVTAWPRGRLELSSLQVATLDPWPGNLGVAFAIGAHQSEEVDVETGVDVSNSRSQAEGLEQSYKRLEATGVIVIDSVGKTWSQVMVVRVRTVIAWNLATGKWRLSAAWRLRPPAVAN